MEVNSNNTIASDKKHYSDNENDTDSGVESDSATASTQNNYQFGSNAGHLADNSKDFIKQTINKQTINNRYLNLSYIY